MCLNYGYTYKRYLKKPLAVVCSKILMNKI